MLVSGLENRLLRKKYVGVNSFKVDTVFRKLGIWLLVRERRVHV